MKVIREKINRRLNEAFLTGSVLCYTFWYDKDRNRPVFLTGDFVYGICGSI